MLLPSITTCSPQLWREKIQEIETLELKEVALFVTGLSNEERAECFRLLEEIKSRQSFCIPFVHAVSSMRDEEYRILSDSFGTIAFNLHNQGEFPLQHPLTRETCKKIYIENTSIDLPIPVADLEAFAGICFDLSHLEDTRRSCPENYERLLNLTKRFPVGANHISAVSHSVERTVEGFDHYSIHTLSSSSQMNYLLDLDPRAFSNLIAIELENSLEYQLRILPRIQILLDYVRPVELRPAA